MSENDIRKIRIHGEARVRGSHPRGPSFFIGLLIVVIGVVLLLDRFGYVVAGDIFRFWPLLLVAAGLAKMLSAREHGGRVTGGILTIVGAVIFCHRFGYIRFDWAYVWPVILIAIGLSLLSKSLFFRSRHREAPKASDSLLNEWVVFGGGRMVNNSPDFQGGEVFATFGGYELDLTKAQMARDEVVLQANALFGGVDIRVPESWSVINKGVGILGGYEDKTTHPRAELGGKQKKLIIKGHAMFGGVDIKN